jgi:hypothetical protein
MTTTAHEPYIEEKGFSETVLNTILFIGIITVKAEISVIHYLWDYCKHKFDINEKT